MVRTVCEIKNDEPSRTIRSGRFVTPFIAPGRPPGAYAHRQTPG